MRHLAREFLKRRIVNYNSNVANNAKNSAVKHFKDEQIPESTIYSIIRTYLHTKTIQFVKSFRNKDGCSQRVSSKKFYLSHRTVGRYLKKNGIDYLKKLMHHFFPKNNFLK